MGMFLLVLSIATHQGETMLVRAHSKKYGKGGTFFNASICFFALIYTIVSEFFNKEASFFFPPQIWLYGIASGICYATGFYAMYLAFKYGSFGMTRLLSTFGIVLSIFYGVIFLKETTTIYTYISLILIVISVFLMNCNTMGNSSTAKDTKKWLVCISLSVIANFGISVLSKQQQLFYGSDCNNEFLILSYAIATVSLLVLGFVTEREKISNTFKKGFAYGIFAGAFNGSTNFLNLMTYMFLPISLISLVKTALGLVITFVISLIIYKERFSRLQYTSAIIGIIAAVLLKL